MKNLQWYAYRLVALFILLLTSCETEPIGDPLPDNDQEIFLNPGEFRARIGNAQFSAGATLANFDADGLLTLTGINQTAGELISLTIENAAEGTFDVTAGPTTFNEGIYLFQQQATNPFTTEGGIGGSGSVTITNQDTELQTITGTFTLNVVRQRLDANGVPIVDSNGAPVFESLVITEGVFSQIPYTQDGQDPDDDDPDDDDPDNEDPDGDENTDNLFEASVDGNAFNATSIFTELAQVGEIPVVRVTAMNANGESIFLNIPESLGIGTFFMSDDDNDGVFDLTQLFGSYRDGNGGNSLTSQSGIMNITDFSVQTGRIFGSFEFFASDPIGEDPSVTLSNGNFRLFYIPNPTNTDPLSCIIDDVPYTPNNFVSFTNFFEGTEQEVVTYRTTDGIQEIRLVFPKDITTGTFAMATAQMDGTQIIGYYIPDTTADTPIEYSSNPGSFTVLSYNTFTGAIEGTFSFTATDPTGEDPINSFEIEEGVFSFIVVD